MLMHSKYKFDFYNIKLESIVNLLIEWTYIKYRFDFLKSQIKNFSYFLNKILPCIKYRSNYFMC
jgi:hypothetical protein